MTSSVPRHAKQILAQPYPGPKVNCMHVVSIIWTLRFATIGWDYKHGGLIGVSDYGVNLIANVYVNACGSGDTYGPTP